MNRLFTNTLRPRSSNYTITSRYVLCHKFSRSRKKKSAEVVGLILELEHCFHFSQKHKNYWKKIHLKY